MILYYLARPYTPSYACYLAHTFFEKYIEDDEYFRNLYFSICMRIKNFTYNDTTHTFKEMNQDEQKNYFYSFYYKDRLQQNISMIVIKLLSNHKTYEIRLYDSWHQIRILFTYNGKNAEDKDFSILTFGFDKQASNDMTDLLTVESVKIREQIAISSDNWIGGKVL